jgi:predicted transcriptional regulator
MRTTVRLNEDLLRRLKAFAAERNRSMTSVLEDAVRQLLDRQEDQPPNRHVELFTYGTGGMVAEVDINEPSTWKTIQTEEDVQRLGRLTDAPS